MIILMPMEGIRKHADEPRYTDTSYYDSHHSPPSSTSLSRTGCGYVVQEWPTGRWIARILQPQSVEIEECEPGAC